jgi:hypothetical protein
MRFLDSGILTPPGYAADQAITRVYGDGAYHTYEHNGLYSGHWSPLGDPELDFGYTSAGCRSYG